MAINRDIWVLLEAEDNKITTPSLALLDEGRRLSREMGSELQAVMFGPKLDEIDKLASSRGVSQLYLFCNRVVHQYSPELYSRLLAQLLSQRKPYLFLAPATSVGSDLMPRVAGMLKAPLVMNCVEVRVQENMGVNLIKPVQNGRLHATVAYNNENVIIHMATLTPDVLTDSREAEESNISKIAEIDTGMEEDDSLVCVTGFLKADHRIIDIGEAEIIVAVGRGIETKENLQMIQELADRIGAAIGGTRPLVDAGILPFERQIGQTGRSISPKLAIICAISGAIEFSKGIERATTKIAINKDREAPIFRKVDLGIVADVDDLVPKIIEYLTGKTEKGEGRAA